MNVLVCYLEVRFDEGVSYTIASISRTVCVHFLIYSRKLMSYIVYAYRFLVELFLV